MIIFSYYSIGIKKPEDSDNVNQEDFNYNSDIIDKKFKQGQQALSIVDILIRGSNSVDKNDNALIDEAGNYIVS